MGYNLTDGNESFGALRRDRINIGYMDFLHTVDLSSRMLAYVKETLASVDSLSKSGIMLPFRSRYAHTERVTGQALRLSEKEGGDAGIIAIAAFFHDCGYSQGGENHASISARIFSSYARQNLPAVIDQINAKNSDKIQCVKIADRFPDLATSLYAAATSEDSLKAIYDVIFVHSDKYLENNDLSLESQILMDADLLDEAGAMAVLFDCFTTASSPGCDYTAAYERILERYNAEKDEINRFHTEEGRRRFLEMRRYVGEFVKGLSEELQT